ncbi:hypothetical protein H8356DRAFT_1656987 [Neocallimastix lanati (nom. inval.)]|nr:hypothetical protein H8356DRAFT_1656987 [Neocallimastix sp. JGI-2020a]
MRKNFLLSYLILRLIISFFFYYYIYIIFKKFLFNHVMFLFCFILCVCIYECH